MSTSEAKPVPLGKLKLYTGNHGAEFCGEACVVEISNLIAAGRVRVPKALQPRCPISPVKFADDHPSISRVIRAYCIGLNDEWNDEDRQRLRPYAARILCTATTDEDEETRAWMATDWLARVHTPAFLRLAGLEEHARALESLARIADATTAKAAQPTLAAARDAAGAAAGAAAWDAAWADAGAAARAAARDAAGAAARDAAWDAAWDAARDAAWDAARDAAWDAAWADAWAAARAAARDAAGAAARDAAWDAARDAAWDAAWAAAGAAARDAAWDALRPVVVELQAKALVLLDEMIEVGR